MPPALACRFTVGELAVLRIVGDEVRQHGCCNRCVDEIAARVGVCRRMVQTALREAARLGLLTVEERRREGRRNLSNVIRIVSREWLAWLAKAIGVRKVIPTAKTDKTGASCASEPVLAAGGQQADSVVRPHKRARHGPSPRC